MCHAIPSGGTIRMPKLKTNTIDTSEYSFAKFAATYFNAQATGYHSIKPLKKPLLEHDLPMDGIAAKVSRTLS